MKKNSLIELGGTKIQTQCLEELYHQLPKNYAVMSGPKHIYIRYDKIINQ